MFKAVEATIEMNGQVHLMEPLHLEHSCRAIVTIIDEPEVSDATLLSQPALAHDWERPEEDAAWSHLK
jgi:hypothetical protein